MNKSTIGKKKTIWSWINQNRLKLAVWLFLIVLPVSLIIITYAGSYISNQSVYFDKEITENSTKINDFQSIDELKAITLDIEWDAFKKPALDEFDNLTGGYYKFLIAYDTKSNYEQVSNVRVTPVLKTSWKNYTSVGTESLIKTSYTSFIIDFNYHLPKTVLPFVTIENPNLYLKVTYSYVSAGQTINEENYVKFVLDDLNPKTVIPNES